MARKAATKPGTPLEVNFELRRGVWLNGRVTDAQTGEGLAGRVAYFVAKESPNYEFAKSLRVDQRDLLRSDDQGNFRIAVLPGPGFVTFMADDHLNYPRAKAIIKKDGRVEKVGRQMLRTVPSNLITTNYHVIAEVDPSAGDRPLELNLQLGDRPSITGRAVDPAGRPVDEYRYSGRLANFGTWQSSDDGEFKLLGYDSKSPRRVYIASADRQLAGHALVQGEPPKDLVVQLQPAGKVRGRLVDKDGAPLANVRLLPWSGAMESPGEDSDRLAPPLPPNVPHASTGRYETDSEGRFAISCLVPGVEYHLQARPRETRPGGASSATNSGPLDVVIKVKSGESQNLGEVRLREADESKENGKSAKADAQSDSPVNATAVTGRVTLSSGKPAAGAHVAVVAKREQGEPSDSLFSVGEAPPMSLEMPPPGPARRAGVSSCRR